MTLIKKPQGGEMTQEEMEMMKHVAHAMCNDEAESEDCWKCVEPCMAGVEHCPPECVEGCADLGACLERLADGPQNEEEAEELFFHMANHACGDVSHD